jgi:hypothetical protein
VVGREYDDTRPWRPITEPGIYAGIPNEAYHADIVVGGSLSCSGAKALLPPNPPAKFAWNATHPHVPTRAMNLGSAAHTLVLGEGDALVFLPYLDYKTTAARMERDAALAAGKVPLLPHEREQVEAMAAALLRHDLAPMLFSTGRPELSAYWVDDEFGVWRRARFDFLPEVVPGRRLIVPDYKTTADRADGASFGRTVANLGYAMQADWYCSALAALDVSADAAFVFVVQEKDPPYLVNVVQLDDEAMRIGRALNRRALAVYADCAASGHWPGYSGVDTATLPGWYVYKHTEDLA